MRYRQTVCKALSTPITMAGGAKKPIIFNTVLAIVTIFATGKFWYTIPFFITHGFIISATKKDGQWFEIITSNLKNKKRYRS